MGTMSEQTSEQAHWTDGTGDARSRRGSGVRTRGLGSDGHSMLLEAVTESVIPRLVALPWISRAPEAQSGASGDASPVVEEAMVKRMLGLCLDSDGQGVALYVAELNRTGFIPEVIYEGLLTPVARTLGDMWENDDCTFADVTIAVLRLQNAQRALAPEFVGGKVAGIGAPRALLLPVPGEQHTFGLSIVRDYFLRAGWEARLGTPGTEAEAVAQVRREPTDLVGLSYACDDHMPTAAALIKSLRKASANKNIVVMVGGPTFSANPALAQSIGADATALDGHQAVLRANELVNGMGGAA